MLGANGGGALVNLLSGLAWFTLPTTGGYSSAKAALWMATNSLRQNLSEQGTLVTGVYAGYIDTDMAAWFDGPKTAPEVVAAATLDGVEADRARGARRRLDQGRARRPVGPARGALPGARGEPVMDDLLKRVLDAHGGLANWRAVTGTDGQALARRAVLGVPRLA